MLNRFAQFLTGVLIFGMIGVSMNALAATSEKEIRDKVTSLEQAWSRGDVDFVVTNVFSTEAVIQGEGQKTAIKTAADIRQVMNKLVGDSRSLKMTIHLLQPLGNQAAMTWVVWHVTPKAEGEAPFDVRSLFVWRKQANGWRIVADSYSFGGM